MKHRVRVENPNAKSHAAAVLLRRQLLESERSTYVSFRESYLDRVMKRDGQLSCHYCGRSGLVSALPDGHTKKDLKNLATLDHIVPRSKGGAEFDEANIVIACHTCNHRKADNLVDDVNGGIAQLAERLLRK